MPVEQNGKKETSRERKRSHTNGAVLSYYILYIHPGTLILKVAIMDVRPKRMSSKHK